MNFKNHTLDDIERSYLKINFLIQKNFAYDKKEAKGHINSVVFHGNISEHDMAVLYVDINGSYQYYVDLEDGYELYNYIDHKALQKEVEKYDCPHIGSFIDYKTLGQDMFNINIFMDAYYHFEGNVFEITEGEAFLKGEEYLDPEIAEYSYELMKELIDDGCSIDMAAKITEGNFIKGDS